MEIRSRYRAVTAEDFEFMAGEASPRVARAVCIPPRDGGAVPLHLVPRVYPADRQLDYDELVPDEALLTEVAEYLDERRLIGTTVELKPCRFRGLSVVVNLQARPLADTARVEEDVAHALYTYLNPLVGGNPTGPRRGLAVRPRAQPGRALRRRARRRRRRVRAHPAPLRDEPGDRRAVGQAGRHAHRARAGRADRVGPAHRQGHAPRGLAGGARRPRRRERTERRRRLRRRADRRRSGQRPPQDVRGLRLRHADAARRAPGPKETPPVASTRAYLRNGLPSLYQDGDFGMRFVGALEELLDPIVAVLDALPAHFDPNHAPRDILELLAAWLGVDLDETQDIRHQREMVRRAAELGRRRGTVKGLELALALHFPELPLRVEDNGGVICARPAGARQRRRRPASSSTATSPSTRTCRPAIARCIEQYKPVHSTYRLRVKAAKKKVET